MGKLRHFFRLSALRDNLEARLLHQEYRSLLVDDEFDDGTEKELRSTCIEVSNEISSHRYRHRHG